MRGFHIKHERKKNSTAPATNKWLSSPLSSPAAPASSVLPQDCSVATKRIFISEEIISLGFLKAPLMEGLLQHQNSTVSFQRNYKSCMWNWLRVFDLNRRFSVMKLIEESSHGSGSHAKGPRGHRLYAPLGLSENENLDGDDNSMIVKKGNQAKEGSSKALVRSLLFKKLFRKHHQKQKPLRPRLTRTNSIHHLECDDYVLPDEVTGYGDRSKIDFGSQKTDFSESNAPQLLPNTRKFRSSGSMKAIDLVGQAQVKHLTSNQEKLVEELQKAHDGILFKSSGGLINRMELLSAQNASFSKMTEDPDFMLENCIKDLRRSRSRRSRRTRSSGELPEYYYSLNTVELKKQGNHETTLTHSENVKKKLKEAVNEKHLHISMDGLVHKIPYGKSVSGEIMKEKLYRSSSASSYQESTGENVGIPTKSHPYQRFRSRSLNESSFIYSHVFESSSLQDRIDANPGFLKSFFSKDVQSEPSNGVLLSKPSPSNLLNNDEAVEIHVPTELESGDNTLAIGEAIEPDAISEQELHANPDAMIDEELELQLILNELTKEEGTAAIPLRNEESLEQRGTQAELQQSGDHEASDSAQMLHSHLMHEDGLGVESVVEATEASSDCVLDLDYGSLSEPTNFDFSAGSDVESRTAHVEEPDLLAKKASSLRHNMDKLGVHADEKDEADFNYVRIALMKSPLNGFDVVGPTLLLLPGDLCDSSDDLEDSSHVSSTDLSADQQVLSDLINETLSELSERFSISNWFSRFDSRTRKMLAECNVLEEVWRRNNLKFSSQGQPPHMYEYVVAEDLAKDEGWLNLKQDALFLGLELESNMLNDLLEDLVIEHFEDIWGHLHLVYT